MTTTVTSSSAPAFPTQVRLDLWRDHDEEVCRQPAATAGSTVLELSVGRTGEAAGIAERLYAQGVRQVTLDRPVDLSGAGGAEALVSRLVLVGQLTSWSVAVDWEVRLGEDTEIWRSLNHLYPPGAVLGTDHDERIRSQWRDTFYVCKCVYRHGPGFIQVRDRRAGGSLARYTLYEPAYLEAVERLVPGCPAEDVPSKVLDALVGEGLAGRAGPLAWWLPYRVRRWPWPSFAV